MLDSGRGPDLGPCADYPDETYTYGQIGIGTCISGPSDIAFFEQDGRTWLAVSNADPYRSFDSGSLLLIDFDSVDMSRTRNTIEDLNAYAVPLESFVGGLVIAADDNNSDDDADGSVDEGPTFALVTGRLTEDSVTREGDDKVWVVDITDPTNPTLAEAQPSVDVRDDPWPIAISEDNAEAFVVNMTDHSVSVLDVRPEFAIAPVVVRDIAPDASFGDPVFDDWDASDSVASLYAGVIDTPELVMSDEWTLTWVEGTYRLWVPSGLGLARYSTGGLETIPSGFGVEIGPEFVADITEARDGFAQSDFGLPMMTYSDEGMIAQATSVNLTSGDWAVSLPFMLTGREDGWDAWLSGPSTVYTDLGFLLFYDGRTAPGEPASIGLARSDDGVTYIADDEALLTPPEGYLSVEDPFVFIDPNTLAVRMWVSLWDGTEWSIGYSASSDGGETWDTIVPIYAEAGVDLAAPAVTWAGGRYLMWAAHGDGTQWQHAKAWSWDGIDWFDRQDVLETQDAFDRMAPPRIAVLSDLTYSWRVESLNTGGLTTLATSGGDYLAISQGFSFRVTNGFEIDTDVLGDLSVNGVRPTSHVDRNGIPTLYVTGLDGNGIRHIGALELDGTTWTSAASDAFPNLDAESPVVFSTASGWTMLFANRVEGIDRIDRASSTDGLAWTVDNEGVVPEGTNWESAGRIPHSVQRLDDGRLRLWYSGTDGSRYRIGSAISDDDGVSFTIELGLTDDYRFGTGQPGEFDDTQVRDPMVVEIDGVVHLWYSAFDGSEWYIGKATLDETGEWVRHISPAFDVVAPLLSGLDRSFSDQGAWSPVVVNDDGEWTVWYAGNDGARDRIGRAFGSSDDVYPQHFVPTADDTITFELERGDDTITAITLDQTIEGFSTLGPDGSQALSDDDPTSAVYDEERGFLYVTQKLSDFIFVLDVRDDSRPGFDDRNYLDIEALLRIRTIPVLTGFRDVALSDDGLLYATSRSPETVMILDISNVEDNAEKDLIYYEDVASLPLQDLSEDEGAPSMGGVGGATLALNQEQNLLIATHFRDNSVSIFDLRLGDWGQEVRYLPELGENPYRVRISPDGRYAVVANYVGDIVDNWVSSTLVVIDIDPASDTYLEAVTWIANL